MKKIHIWGRLNSINAQKVFWLCEDLHIEFDRTNAGLEFFLEFSTYTQEKYMGAGETIALADITLALIAYRWFNLPIEREKFEHLDAWFKNATQKPGFLKYGSSPLT